MIDERCGGGLTIRASDANHLRVGVSASELNLTEDMNTFTDDFLNHGSGIGDAWTLDNLVGIENLFLCVLSFFPFNLVVVQQFLIFVGNLRHV